VYPAPIVPTITQKNNILMVRPFFSCICINIIFILLLACWHEMRGPPRNLAQVWSVHSATCMLAFNKKDLHVGILEYQSAYCGPAHLGGTQLCFAHGR
jgi:hypothetical protein